MGAEIIFTERDQRKIRPSVIRLEENKEQIKIKDSIKYLRLVIDRTMNYTEHIKCTRAKVLAVSKKIINAVRRTFRKKSTVHKDNS